MIIHHIHDLSNSSSIDFLKKGIDVSSKNTSNYDLLKNYHPEFQNSPSNLFFILKNGRYSAGHGKYFIIEEDNQYICSAGWNEYDYDTKIALLLTRMFVNPRFRAQYYAGNYILPVSISETEQYDRSWITFNQYNYSLYKWFERADAGKRTVLFNDWPEIYRKFKPIGKKEIYFTEQYVVELNRERE